MGAMCSTACTLLPDYINLISWIINQGLPLTAPESTRYEMNINELNSQDLGTVLKKFGALF